MKLTIPEPSLVLLVGTSGSGKSTFARTHFRRTEVLSSDFFRGLIADDETDQAATADAFDALHFVAAKRLAAGRLTVIDATNVQLKAREPLIALARRFQVLLVAIVLDVPERTCAERNRARPDRQFGPHVLARQRKAFMRSIASLGNEGFHHIYILAPRDIDSVDIVRQPPGTDRRGLDDPFDPPDARL
jgi:protein phosphatase